MSTHDSDLRERPVGELVKELAGQTSTLVRQEIQLAQAEISTKGKLAGRGAGMLAAAAVAGLLALIALTAGLVAALDTAMPLWLAALIVTVLWAVSARCSRPADARSCSTPHPQYPNRLSKP